VTSRKQSNKPQHCRNQRSNLYFTITIIAFLWASIFQHVAADNADKNKPLALRKIMQDMGKNMQSITDGISREDWKLVAKTAPLIADHPQPPLIEKVRILSFIGSDVGSFKHHDQKTHEVAKTLEQAAMQGDGDLVISTFAQLQKSCLACHVQYRTDFVEHFYNK
jgi:cytochrome c556